MPHLSDAAKAELEAAIPPHQREARSKGIPSIGSGKIYPVPEADIVVADFAIPDHWPRAYGMDVGWQTTACIWGALDRDSDVLYLYSEHYAGDAIPAVHAQAIKARGEWIPGSIDPASRGRSQIDGQQLIEIYRSLGLDLEPANNAVSAGIYEIWQRMVGGRFKVFASLQNWIAEFRLYRRDEKGKLVKVKDHAQDACRYLVMSGLDRARVKPPKKAPDADYVVDLGGQFSGWME